MYLPKHILTNDHYWDSPFKNHECETILRNVVKMQKTNSPEAWIPFTWEQYKAFCTHPVTSIEKGVLDAFVNGGKPVWNTTTSVSPGWLTFDGTHYHFTPETIQMLGDKYHI